MSSMNFNPWSLGFAAAVDEGADGDEAAALADKFVAYLQSVENIDAPKDPLTLAIVSASAFTSWQTHGPAILRLAAKGKSLDEIAASLGHAAWIVRVWIEHRDRRWKDEGHHGPDVDALARLLGNEPAANAFASAAQRKWFFANLGKAGGGLSAKKEIGTAEAMAPWLQGDPANQARISKTAERTNEKLRDAFERHPEQAQEAFDAVDREVGFDKMHVDDKEDVARYLQSGNPADAKRGIAPYVTPSVVLQEVDVAAFGVDGNTPMTPSDVRITARHHFSTYDNQRSAIKSQLPDYTDKVDAAFAKAESRVEKAVERVERNLSGTGAQDFFNGLDERIRGDIGKLSNFEEFQGRRNAANVVARLPKWTPTTNSLYQEVTMPKQSPLPLPTMNFGADSDVNPCSHSTPAAAPGYPREMFTYDPNDPGFECDADGEPLVMNWWEEWEARRPVPAGEHLPLPKMEF